MLVAIDNKSAFARVNSAHSSRIPERGPENNSVLDELSNYAIQTSNLKETQVSYTFKETKFQENYIPK